MRCMCHSHSLYAMCVMVIGVLHWVTVVVFVRVAWGCGRSCGLRMCGMGLQSQSMRHVCCGHCLRILCVVVASAVHGVAVMVVVPRVVYVATKCGNEVARRDVATWHTQPGRVQRGRGHICVVVVVSNNRWVDLDNFLLNVALS